MNALFVTATDTGVGKTVITAGIARALKVRGVDVGVMKPVSCGVRPDPATGREVHSDTEFLRRSIDSSDPVELINPAVFKEPAAPTVAAEREGSDTDLVKLYEAFKTLKDRHEFLLVEGVGGLLVPIRRGYLVADLIREWGAPILIVGRAGLGTINHTLLTIRQALAQGLVIRGVVLNHCDDRPDGVPEQTNAAEIEAEGAVRVLGTFPFDRDIDVDRCRYGNLTEETMKNIHLEYLYTKRAAVKP